MSFSLLTSLSFSQVIEIQQRKAIEGAEQREELLRREKQRQGELIAQIFPKAVANQLLKDPSFARSKSNSFGDAEDSMVRRHPPPHSPPLLPKLTPALTFFCICRQNHGDRVTTLCRTVAFRHENVTILFTDIVGFTSMSQTVAPQQVMEFLHDLFVRFDDLVDMDPSLWKVETIGDAFMVASGLEGVRTRSRELAISDPSSIGSCLCPATAAVLFGKSALAEARTLTMPNSMQCQIRAGVHTGDVCSGVVGTRMPRYCLFGDTVNTASRMESSGVPGRMQISEATHALVCGDDSDFCWDERGYVEVKGKGKLKTYLLRDGDTGAD